MGGVWDRELGQIVWEFNVPLAAQREHYRAHPPSALAGLRCTAIELPEQRFDGHGEPVNAIFRVACPCGSALFVAGGWVDEHNDIGPPVTLTCAACEAAYDVFDDQANGHDSVMRGSISTAPAGHPDDYPAPDAPYEIILRFEFASDMLGSDRLPGREHDAFTWITILAQAPDGERTVLLDWECA